MKLNYLVPILFCFTTFSVHARFEHEDAKLIDREDQHSSEAFIDMLSYRPTIYSQKLWEESSNGYFINVGSLNVTRFLHDEELKVETGNERAYLSYYRKKQQDMVVDRDQSLIQVSWLDMIPEIGIAFLGEGDSFKEYADLGFAIHSAKMRQNFFWQFNYLLIDIPYNNKKKYPEDKMVKEPKSYQILMKYKIDGLFTKLLLEVDTPVDWEKNSDNLHYFNEHNSLEFELRFLLNESLWSMTTLMYDSKREEKESFYVEQNELIKNRDEATREISTEPSFSKKGLLRKIYTLETKLRWELDEGIYETGVWGTLRNSKYHFEGYLSPIEGRHFDAKPSSSMTRKEYSLFVVREPSKLWCSSSTSQVILKLI